MDDKNRKRGGPVKGSNGGSPSKRSNIAARAVPIEPVQSLPVQSVSMQQAPVEPVVEAALIDLSGTSSAMAMATALSEEPAVGFVESVQMDADAEAEALGPSEDLPAANALMPIATGEASPKESQNTDPVAEAAPDMEVTSPPQAPPASVGFSPRKSQKDFIMDMTTNFGSGLNDVLAEAQGKAKEVYEKSSTMLGEAGSFTRGNVEAVVESGKILAAGLQDMSTNLVAESRGAFETMTADLKELAASKTPADFMKAQGEMMRKSLDTAVAYGSKNSEAMLKLVNDALAPLSGRVNLAVDKVKSTSL